MIKWLNVLWIVLLIVGCKKAFTPKGALSSTNKYLVIEGVINSGSDSTFIKLSRTKKFDTVITIDAERNAQISVESDANSSYPLAEVSPGTYSAAPLNLDNARKYRLRIRTTDSKVYLSDFVPVKNAPPVDSVGFIAQTDGVHIYVNSHDAASATHYYRWEYNEDWQFHSRYESFWLGLRPRLKEEYKYYCFAKDVSSSILIASTTKLAQDVVYQAPIATIPSNSEKIELKYSILLKQYALTSDAYSFWENLQKNTDRLGSIFDAQPSENQSNYHNVSDANEVVIGYLSAGNPSTKRIFISASQLLPGYSPKDLYGCKLDTAYYFHTPFYYDGQILGPNSGNETIDGFYSVPVAPLGAPTFVTYSTIICNDCTLRGNLKQPAFWK